MVVVEIRERMVVLSFGERRMVGFKSSKDGKIWLKAGQTQTTLFQLLENCLPAQDGKYILKISFEKID